MKSIGTTLKKTTNQQMNPYLYYPQYGFGSWLKENAGTIGSVVGAGLGTLIAPGIGTQIGATLGGSIGGSVQQNNATNIAQTEQQSQLNTQAALANYNALNMNAPKYSSTFKNGGNIYPVMNSLACGGKLKAMGGKLESSDKIDGIAIYKNGGTHEESPIGGIPIGRLGRVEEGEVRFGNYIFSNRF